MSYLAIYELCGLGLSCFALGYGVGILIKSSKKFASAAWHEGH